MADLSHVTETEDALAAQRQREQLEMRERMLSRIGVEESKGGEEEEYAEEEVEGEEESPAEDENLVRQIVLPEDLSRPKDWWRCKDVRCGAYIYSEPHADTCPFRSIGPQHEDTEPTSVPAQLLGDEEHPPASSWKRYTDAATGKEYFHNTETGVTQWEIPEELSNMQIIERSTGEHNPEPARSPVNVYDKLDRILKKRKAPEDSSDKEEENNGQGSGVEGSSSGEEQENGAPAADSAPQQRPPSTWQAIWDAKTQAYYYYNTYTGLTTWEKPPSFENINGQQQESTTGAPSAESTDPSAGQSTMSVVDWLKLQAQQTAPGVDFGYNPKEGLGARREYDRAARQMSFYFDLTKLEENRQQTKVIQQKLAQSMDWREYRKEQKKKKKKQQLEWLLKD